MTAKKDTIAPEDTVSIEMTSFSSMDNRSLDTPKKTHFKCQRKVWTRRQLVSLVPSLLCLAIIASIEITGPLLLVKYGCREEETMIGQEKPQVAPTSKILVLADVHVGTLCPYTDIWSTLTSRFAHHFTKPDHVVVLGDVNSWGGGSTGQEISDEQYDRQAARFRRITGCTKDSDHCIIVPGNHDEKGSESLSEGMNASTRWISHYGNVNYKGVLTNGLTYYALNSENPHAPPEGIKADLIFSHRPIVATLPTPKELPERERSMMEKYSDLFNNSEIRVALSGHFHVASRRIEVNGTTEMNFPTISATRALSSDSLQSCFGLASECTPGPGFGILNCYDTDMDGVVDTVTAQICQQSPFIRPIELGGYGLLSALTMAFAIRKKAMKITLAVFSATGILTFVITYFPVNV